MSGLRQWKHWRAVRSVLLGLVVFLGVRAFQGRTLAHGRAPELGAVDLKGERIELAARRGTPLVVHFWATWCGVCRAEEHNIKALAENATVISVASLSGGDAEVAHYAQANALPFPIVNDQHGTLAARYGVRAFPTSFVIDGDGEIRSADVGYTTELGLRARLWWAELTD